MFLLHGPVVVDTIKQKPLRSAVQNYVLSIPLFYERGGDGSRARARISIRRPARWNEQIPVAASDATVLRRAVAADGGVRAPATWFRDGSRGIPEMRKRGYSRALPP